MYTIKSLLYCSFRKVYCEKILLLVVGVFVVDVVGCFMLCFFIISFAVYLFIYKTRLMVCCSNKYVTSILSIIDI